MSSSPLARSQMSPVGILYFLLVSVFLLLLLQQLLTHTGGGGGDFIQNFEGRQSISPSSGVEHSVFRGKESRFINQAENARIDGGKHPVLPSHNVPLQHPCVNFSSYPPLVDKKHTGYQPCPVCYVPVELAIALMPSSSTQSHTLRNLTYVTKENTDAHDLNQTSTKGSSLFGGHPSLKQRNESFDVRESMTVHCGFVGGKKPACGTGFDIEDLDLLEMEQCHGVVVASAIFGNYDVLQQPKNISDFAKANVCFYMFIDEETQAHLKNSSGLNSIQSIGLWRLVVIHNLPYSDPRRNGKVPKLLLHRLFPHVRFSLWIDAKLELVADPYQILERFLWRENATFAISNHYERFDVFDEAEANKASGRISNTSIEDQIKFYVSEGLTHYSEAKLPIVSDVPEGCVIIREHIPITNLFTCLWFNEVDRFTARDQLSFSTVRDKIMSKVAWKINMFKDCERRNFVIQVYHKYMAAQMNSSTSYSRTATTSDNSGRRRSSRRHLTPGYI